jgi:glycine dehydrogenase subunit 1
MVTAATIYMSLLGYAGLRQVALRSQQNTAILVEKLLALNGVERLYEGSHFHEVALRLGQPVAQVLDALARRDILGGYDLGDALLVCATETKTAADIDAYVAAMDEILNKGDRLSA